MSAMCVCVSLLKGLPQKDAKLRNGAEMSSVYAGHSVIACFVVLFFSFAEITKAQVERFVIFSYFDRQITKRGQNYETSTLQTCHRSQKGAPLACHRAAASRPCHAACRDVLGSIYKNQVAGYCVRHIGALPWPLDRMWRVISFLV